MTVINGAIVMTTIFDPLVLESYFENLEAFGHLGQVQAFVIPDRKTPSSAYKRCSLLRERGLNVAFPSFEEQEGFLKRVDFPPEWIPYDSDNRRNVGFLMALDSAADFIISVDDDNFCRAGDDFFSEHAVVCNGAATAKTIDSSARWFNVCRLMNFDRGGPVYARGFPYYARHRNGVVSAGESLVELHMNAGLWLGDPDLDGLSWLVCPMRSTDFSGESVVLSPRTWSPINSQNTALRRSAVASYYFVKMGHRLAGLTIDRDGDIFSGYFAQACVHHLGGAVRVGTPLAQHKRNSHNYLRDALNEWGCILVLEELLPWLTEEAKLQGTSYPEAYISLSHAMDDAIERFQGSLWTPTTRDYFHEVADYMRRWADVCRCLGC